MYATGYRFPASVLREWLNLHRNQKAKTQMPRRFRFNDESLNAYGFWVRNDGIDFSDFEKNPVCLYNHERGWRGTKEDVMPIGFWEDLNKEEMTAVPNLYEEDEWVQSIAGRIKHGTLRGASMGITILEWSEDPSYLKPGQTRPTVVKCKLKEISIVDIPANKNALVLYDVDGNQINLGDNGEGLPLPLITSKKDDMNLTEIALKLGLAPQASLADITARIEELQLAAQEHAVLKAQLHAELARRKAELKEKANLLMEEANLDADERKAYEQLFEMSFEAAETALKKRPKVVSLADYTKSATGGKTSWNGKTFKELEKENPEALRELKRNDLATFKSLYKASYGVEYKG